MQHKSLAKEDIIALADFIKNLKITPDLVPKMIGKKNINFFQKLDKNSL